MPYQSADASLLSLVTQRVPNQPFLMKFVESGINRGPDLLIKNVHAFFLPKYIFFRSVQPTNRERK